MKNGTIVTIASSFQFPTNRLFFFIVFWFDLFYTIKSITQVKWLAEE